MKNLILIARRRHAFWLSALLGVTFIANPCHSSAGAVRWTGAGGDLEWATPGNWSSAGIPAAADQVFFFDEGAAVASGEVNVNNRLSASQTVASLTYGNTNKFHNTVLQPGVKLTVSNDLSGPALMVGTGVDNGGAQTVTTTISGVGGTLQVLATNAGSQFNVRQGSASSGAHRATLDLYSLDNLQMAVGRLLVAGDGSASSVAAHNRPAGTLILAKTNLIQLNGAAPAFNVGDSGGSSGTSFVELGLTNAIFSDSLTIARQKCIATLRFYAYYMGWNPALFLRGTSGERVLAMALGDNSAQSTSSVASTGTIDLTGGTTDAMVDTCILGRGLNGNGTGQASGTLTFDAGVFDVNIMRLGYVNINTAVANVTGTVNVNGTAALIVNDTLQLGRNPGANATAKGTLNINGGTVKANSIITSSGNVNSEIVFSSGALFLTNSAGTPDLPLASVTLNGATLNLFVRNDQTNIVTLAGLGASTTINILTLPLIMSYPAQFPLISYASGFYDAQLGTLPAASTPFQGYISNNLANSSIDLVITDGPPPPRSLTWSGSPSGNWDTTTANWLFGALPAAFRQLDGVTFDDTATGTTTVNLSTALSPSALAVNNVGKAYTFTGPGSLTGTNGLVKTGAGTLTIANTGSNDFVGGVAINAGKVQLGGSADRLPLHADLVLADQAGTSLDLNDLDQTLASISGGGAAGGDITLGSGTLTFGDGSGVFNGAISGTGSVVKAGTGDQVLAGANLYTGGTWVTAGRLSVANPAGSGTGSGFVQVETNATISLGAGGTAGSIAAAVITNNGTVRLDRSDDFTLSNAIVGWGGVTKANTNTVLVPISNTYTGVTTISDGALRVSHPQALGDTTSQTVFGSAIASRLELTGNITLLEPIRLSQKGTSAGRNPSIVNISGTNTLAGQIDGVTGGSYWTLRPDQGLLIVSGVFSNLTVTGNRYLRLLGEAVGDWQTDYANNVEGTSINHLLKDDGGTWTLSGVNSYNGITYVAGGLLLVNGSILNSSSVQVTNGILGGVGVIKAPVTVGALGRLAPGIAIGTLTINNSLTLNGITEMEVAKTGADKITGLTTIALGGTLKVSLAGDLNGTEVFKLFEAAAYTGNFADYILPSLNPPLAWDTSSVAVDGTLRVTGGSQPPQIAGLARTSDGNFRLSGSGPNGAPYRILATTNIAAPLSAWSQIATGSFIGGEFAYTDLTATNNEVRFYTVVTP